MGLGLVVRAFQEMLAEVSDGPIESDMDPATGRVDLWVTIDDTKLKISVQVVH
jgi:hypothetical protein